MSDMRALATATTAAYAVNVSASTIRTWASRGELKPVCLDERGRKLYDMIDVYRAEQRLRGRGRPRSSEVDSRSKTLRHCVT